MCNNRVGLTIAALVALTSTGVWAAKGPFDDQPAGPQSLPGDLLPPFNMLDESGQQLKPFPKLDGPVDRETGGEPESAAPGPSLAVATELARATVEACQKQGYRIGAAVVNSAGEARAMLTADGSDGSHVFVAMRKALAALVFAVPSSEAYKLVSSDKTALAKVTPAMFLAGGAVPITSKGKLIGAVGASGAAGSGPFIGYQDEQCAKAGLASVAGRL